MLHTRVLLTQFAFIALLGTFSVAEERPKWPIVQRVDTQPLVSQMRRLANSLQHIGNPLPAEIQQQIAGLTSADDAAATTRLIQEWLDPLCIAAVELQPEGKPPVVIPRWQPNSLFEQGWQRYLVKVINVPEYRTRLRVDSPQAKPLANSPSEEVDSRWMSLTMFDGQPMTATLSGLPLEYRIVEIYSREPGQRTAKISFAAPSIPANQELKGNTSIISAWHFDSTSTDWEAMNQSKVSIANNQLVVESTGDDPFIGTKLKKPAEPGNLVLRFWATAEQGGVGQVFWWTTDRPTADGNHVVAFNIEAGAEKLYEIPFSDKGQVIGVRIDPGNSPGKTRIAWIELAYADRGNDWGSASFPLETRASTEVKFTVNDEQDRPAMGCFEITDSLGRVYPPQTKRLAPDFFFQRQIYRSTGETVRLPAGKYNILCSRGPETVAEIRTLVVEDKPVDFEYTVKRWIDPSRRGYWSGDHHVHAAGCAHYENPTQGVHPPDMLRHCMGEDLKVGCCLTWGPCFDYQKRFFTGKPDDISRYPYIIRYDVEVSGFGSHVSGHLNLLRLKQQIPDGGDSKDHWPTLGLNTLRWAKKQGAVCGPAHSANGLTRYVDRLPDTEGKDGPNGLPTFYIPAFDGIGANEFIMNVTHEVPGADGKPTPAVDFISTMDTDRSAELNMWYHVLNCGYRVRASGETDFPCISGERVGLGRSYVRLDGELNFDRWCDALAAGRSYISDGRAHLMEFSALASTPNAETLEIGTRNSEINIKEPTEITFTAAVAARYEDRPQVAVELIINGFPVATQQIVCDGTEQRIEFKQKIEKSSWVAIRTFPGAHTNPCFVIVDQKPIRANRLSAQWCLQCVEQCWKTKAATYHPSERETAAADYEHARQTFRRIIDESK